MHRIVKRQTHVPILVVVKRKNGVVLKIVEIVSAVLVDIHHQWVKVVVGMVVKMNHKMAVVLEHGYVNVQSG
jgi:hypothetical protein